MRSRPRFGRIAATALETLAWVGLATALVALLDSVAEPAGLGSIYLIAVLAVAIRRGQVAALAAAVLGVLTLNYFFIKPLHQLTIADSDNVVALGGPAARCTARRSPRRAVAPASRRGRAAGRPGRRAGARGDACSPMQPPRCSVGPMILWRQSPRAWRRQATGSFALTPAPRRRAREGERVLRLPTEERSVWLYAGESSGWSDADLNRVARPLATLLDVAAEREHAAARGAEAEAARQADAAKTVILHAVSHDLRSPLTVDPHRGGRAARAGNHRR